MVRLGIIGNNFGRLVQGPAFRADPRCQVVALAGTDVDRTRRLAQESGIPKGYGTWQDIIDDPEVDAVAIAVPPAFQPSVAVAALARGKPVFAEKPMAADLAGALAMTEEAERRGHTAMIDFEFTVLPAWQRAKEMIGLGAIGPLRHLVVTWMVENPAVRMRQWSWKSTGEHGGGVLGNLVSHSLHYLEWFCGPIAALSARLSQPPDPDIPVDTIVALSFSLAAGGSGVLTVSIASYLGSGHRLEFYGRDGTLVLSNSTADYMHGFTLQHARRPAATLERVPVEELWPDNSADRRIAPVARLASRFLDSIETGSSGSPSFRDGLRVQQLMDAVMRSHAAGCRIDTPLIQSVMR